MEDIVENLQADGSAWANETLHLLSQMSPTSLKISLRLLQEGAELDLQEALRTEYRLSQRCCEKHDFREGTTQLNHES